ncbi:hypothetical protein SAY87_024843 [Trapa incisa]|uniref:START domain-containing protein n=1 Tax=Trapa incisa TaxID=236973 RepID=A0AAN7GF02_9MYRT|nr:hypothetical protein SAY87_024843 [Trapa incisa]
MGMASVVLEILKGPGLGVMVSELVKLMVPIWVALFVGVFVGWIWRPKWATLAGAASSGLNETPPSSSGGVSSTAGAGTGQPSKVCPAAPATISSCSKMKSENDKSSLVNSDDLEHLCLLVELKDGGPAWIQMMDRSTATMSYQAWRRDPQTGPPQYKSRTVFEDATPELVRDFFWDDEFRMKWDEMLLSASILEECSTTGTMMVQWVRKFPFFCSDREYIIGRRIWESGQAYYCVTKGVPCSTVPRLNKPRRVDLYYSSWCIRAVESRGDGQRTACEVILFHHEDMGIPWEIAKLGVRQGMWGAVKKIEPGLRSYQKGRASEKAPISRCAFLAQINTKLSEDHMNSLKSGSSSVKTSEIDNKTLHTSEKDRLEKKVPKLLVYGAAVLLACSLDRGLLTRALIFGTARRVGRIGKR